MNVDADVTTDQSVTNQLTQVTPQTPDDVALGRVTPVDYERRRRRKSFARCCMVASLALISIAILISAGDIIKVLSGTSGKAAMPSANWFLWCLFSMLALGTSIGTRWFGHRYAVPVMCVAAAMMVVDSSLYWIHSSNSNVLVVDSRPPLTSPIAAQTRTTDSPAEAKVVKVEKEDPAWIVDAMAIDPGISHQVTISPPEAGIVSGTVSSVPRVTNDWLDNVSGKHLTIQLLATRDKNRLRSFIEANRLAGARVFSKLTKDGEIFTLVFGNYITPTAALTELATLPDTAVKFSKLVRSFQSIRTELKVSRDLLAKRDESPDILP